MKYIINYTEQGKILGFAKSDENLNIEVSNAIWFEAQSYNKIIIDGENISFELVDWRTDEEIESERLIYKTQEAQSYLSSTDWINTYKIKHDLGLEIIPETSSKWEIINKRTEYIKFLKGDK